MTANKSREELFSEHAKTYPLCFSVQCTLREHCLHSLLNEYADKTQLFVITSINLNNPLTQTENCPNYASDEAIEMPTGIAPIYHDMPGWMEKKIKSSLIAYYSRKRYYMYHNGTLPMTPDVERHVRKTAKDAGWDKELIFAGSIIDYKW